MAVGQYMSGHHREWLGNPSPCVTQLRAFRVITLCDLLLNSGVAGVRFVISVNPTREWIVPTVHLHPRQAFELEDGPHERNPSPGLNRDFLRGILSQLGAKCTAKRFILARLHSMRVPRNKANQGICREQAVGPSAKT